MAKPLAPSIPLVRRTLLRTDRCLFCQITTLQSSHHPIVSQARKLNTTSRRLQQSQQQQPRSQPSSSSSSSLTQKQQQPQPTPRTLPSRIPLTNNRPHVRSRDGELAPAPLTAPLGLPYPPRPGENTGTDTRTWRQRREDFASYDKHLERRQDLIKNLYQKNYFRDLGNVGRIHKGKSMLAPSTPFRRDVAMWFPNFRGGTLVSGSSGREQDTTPVLAGRISIVKLMSTDWGNLQAESFVGPGVNRELWEVLEGGAPEGSEAVQKSEDVHPQLIELNIEPNILKYWLMRLSAGKLRKERPQDQWSKYFQIKNGMTDEIREALGIWNSKVGYVYLLDRDCKIRWAGNGDAREDERQSLVRCVRRLVDEAKGVERTRVKRADPDLVSASLRMKEGTKEEKRVTAAAAS